jgi:hypothetical protein
MTEGAVYARTLCFVLTARRSVMPLSIRMRPICAAAAAPRLPAGRPLLPEGVVSNGNPFRGAAEGGGDA